MALNISKMILLALQIVQKSSINSQIILTKNQSVGFNNEKYFREQNLNMCVI